MQMKDDVSESQSTVSLFDNQHKIKQLINVPAVPPQMLLEHFAA
jgi:hypothetical protein